MQVHEETSVTESHQHDTDSDKCTPPHAYHNCIDLNCVECSSRVVIDGDESMNNNNSNFLACSHFPLEAERIETMRREGRRGAIYPSEDTMSDMRSVVSRVHDIDIIAEEFETQGFSL